ncbi:MAG: alpha/beta hydrolase [Desulfocapsa sp.]|nr:MAG: alpha/beta hydrolase [Desulfocapsa sp.]
METYTKLDQPEILATIFHQEKCSRTMLPYNAEDIGIEVEPGIIIGCRFYVHKKNSPNILYFHGNGERVCDYDEIGPFYNAAGINLLVVDYRGYGWSGGTPTVSNMLEDAEVLFRETRNYLSFNGYSGAFFLMGRSLGSISAIDLAKNHEEDIKGLILESAIADTLPLAKSLGLDLEANNFTEDDGFQNLQKIKKVTIPTFIFHGARDELIPANEAEKLQASSGARTKEFVIIPGAQHNTMIAVGGQLYFETIKKFIDKLTGVSSWRKRRKAAKQHAETN